MHSYRSILLITVFFLTSERCFSATVYTWSSLVSKASEQNTDLLSAKSNLDASLSDQKKSYAKFLPKISVGLSKNESQVESDDRVKSYVAQLNLSQNLFAGFQDYQGVKLANAELATAQANYTTTFLSVQTELMQAFQSVLYAKQLKKLTENIIQRRRDNLANVQLRFLSGRENKGSLLLSEAYVEQSKYDDLQSMNEAELAKKNILRLLAIDEFEDIQFENDASWGNAIALPKNMNPNIDEIVNKHPDYLIEKSQLAAAEANYKISQSAFYPNFDLTGSYGYNDSKYFPETRKWSIGLTLSLPLFEGGQSYFAARSSGYKLTAKEQNFSNQIKKIKDKVQKVFFDYQEALQKEKLDESFLKASEVRAEIARSKYKNGLMSFDDWDVIENDLIQRQKSALSSHKDRVNKYALWLQAQGTEVIHEKK